MKPTAKQLEAQKVLSSDATHIMLFGGSRSGKTFWLTRNVCLRALKAPGSRHLITRFRLNHIKASVVMDTFPKVMRLAFPGVKYDLNKTDLYATLPGDSQIWFAGLDDKERTEKILGNEYATIYHNECSQIPYNSIQTANTRLAQLAYQKIEGMPETLLKNRIYYDCNPPPKNHWTYKVFKEKRDPDTGKTLSDPGLYESFQINPGDNQENLSPEYLKLLQGMSERMRKRFLEGEFAEANPDALFPDDTIARWKVENGEVPQLVRIIVGVDPSGASDDPEQHADAIGIVVAGLGVDGNAYVLEDLTLKAGPATWGRMAVSAYDRHQASVIVGERNFGGEMVRFVIQTAAKEMGLIANFKLVQSSVGKTLRAEPFSALYEQGKVRHVGEHRQLEEELAGFSTFGYTGAKSPNRADALVFALAELFPGIVRKPKPQVEGPKLDLSAMMNQTDAWMA